MSLKQSKIHMKKKKSTFPERICFRVFSVVTVHTAHHNNVIIIIGNSVN